MLLLAALASGADPARDWGTLYDARLVEAIDGTPAVAAELYGELMEDRPPTDPLYAATSFWLGRVQLELDRVEAAVVSLSASATDPELREASIELLEEAELRGRAVRELPSTWDFESGTFPAVRSVGAGGRGEVAPRKVDDRLVLSWGTTIRPGEPDRLSLRFAEEVAPRELRFSARTVEQPAILRVVARDRDGRAWTSTDLRADNRDWTEIGVLPGQFVPDGVGSQAARMGQVVELRIEDVTGERTSARGENTLLLDDVSVR